MSTQAPSRPDQPDPKPPVGTPAGRTANAASFTLGVLSSLAQAWTLISVGRALGALAPTLTGAGTTPGPVGTYLVQALVAALLAALTQVGVETVSRASATSEEAHLRRRVLSHLLDLGPARATHLRSGSTVSLLTDGAERVALYRQTFLAPTLASVLAPAFVLVLLAVAVDPLPSLVLGAAVVLVPAFITFFHKHSRRSSARSRRQRARLAGAYLDAIQGLTTLTLARAAHRTAVDLRQAGEDNRRAVMGLLAGNQRVIFLTDSLFSLFFVTAAAALALARLAAGAIDLGGALALVLTSFVLLEPLDRVGAFFYVGMGGMANQRAIRQVLATQRPQGAPETAPDRQPAATSGGRGDGVGSPAPAAETAEHPLRLQQVTAAWEEGRPVLSGVSLQLEPGQKVALVGPSGAGKSTLMSLVGGDLLPAAGSVHVAGTPLTAATQDAVRAASALVAQSTWLFCGSIADNLRVANPQATTEQLWQALADANLAEEVRLMPEGLDTVVGEMGMGLSGGQAQRVSLARAFLADRPLLLLDEPTSQVDLAGEAQILQALERLSQGRTVLTVSHRQGAVDGADRVLRVADGRVEEVA